jgi:hypothetical protein
MDSGELDRFLVELGRRVNGDPSGTTNMWAVGQDIGLDRGDTESIATQLMGQGLVEVKTLDGKVGLTAVGAERVSSLAALFPGGKDDGPSWPEVVAGIEAATGDLSLTPAARGDFLADLGCLKLQLSKDRPLPAVMTACAESVARVLSGYKGRDGVAELVDRLARIIHEGS